MDEWTPITVFLPRQLISGERSGIGEVLMRRKVKGQWQYRRPDAEELREHAEDEAW